MENVSHCTDCGAATGFDGAGPIFIVRSDSLLTLSALLNGELDEDRCTVCGHKLSFAPTIAVYFEGTATVVVAPGDLFKRDYAANISDLRERFERTYADLGFKATANVVTVDGLDALRQELLRRMTQHLPVLKELDEASKKGRLTDHILEQWRRMTPEVFVAAHFITVGMAIAKRQPPGSLEIKKKLLILGERQAFVWMALCMTWGRTPPADGLFENDLSSYAVSCAILPSWVEKFGAEADRFRGVNPSETATSYCLEALRATLYDHLGAPNPRAGEWARMLICFELRLRETKPSDPVLQRLRISQRRARETVTYQTVFDAVLPLYSHPQSVHGVGEVLTYLGLPEVLSDLPRAVHTQSTGSGALPSATAMLKDLLRNVLPDQPDVAIPAVLGALQAVETVRPSQLTADEYEEMADAAVMHVPAGAEARAVIDTWLGAKLNALRQPERVLKHIGTAITTTEERLQRDTRIGLWTERGTALRYSGDMWGAKACYERVAALFDGEPASKDARTARRNLALALRETGAPDRALAMLQALHSKAIGSERLQSFENLAVTHLVLGQKAQALAAIDSALELAVGPFASHRAELLAKRLMMTAAGSQPEATIALLLQLPEPSIDNPHSLLAQASAWLNALFRMPTGAFRERFDVQDRVQALTDALLSLREKAKENGDLPLELDVLSILAHLCDLFHLSDSLDLWREVDSLCVASGRGRNTAALLALARSAYSAADVADGRSLLEQVPLSLGTRLGNVQRLEVVADALTQLGWMFDRATRAVVEQSSSSPEDLRLAAEVGRDAIRRATQIGFHSLAGAAGCGTELTWLFRPPSDQTLACLAPRCGALGVLEWIDAGISRAMLLTIIPASGAISSHWLRLPKVELEKLPARILAKLNQWTLRRPGDPFEFEAWQVFENWMIAAISPYLPPDNHLAVIEHPDFSGLPWHVAASARWSCSYASGWSTLLALADKGKGDTVQQRRLGVACVPTFDDGMELAAALRGSAEGTVALAAAYGLACESAFDADCDNERLGRLMQECSLLKLLCHGYFSQEEREVALMISAGGHLPLKLPQAADTPLGRAHRFSWRHIAGLSQTPHVVFSAACSSLRSHIAGQGERLGLFQSLHERGTQSLVAPAWDIEPAIVLPVLDAVLEKYLEQRSGLGKLVREACRKAVADQKIPRWLAWSLSIEGDWQ
jgi:tetratricopeptide (TPR) repeat protein